ncbi:GNAT family N-acetyltransferase [Rhizobium wenxiniae]|uniref:GNAT family N-acetyltransferase n=1 Tax=Rhizobium wenxiniae TaxID=1737357 RepID=UPI001CB76FA3|nr:GNAT family N-acetyltransferase [Rhizobium wenxiniae]
MITIRMATEADLPDIVQMLADDELGAVREVIQLPLSQAYLDAFAKIKDDPNQFLAIGEMDGVPVATLQVSIIPTLARSGALRGQIEGVRVARSHRGYGLGHAVFEWAIDYCRQRGCELVQLTSDKSREDAHRFYENLGFVPSHTGFKLVITQ